MNNSEFRNYLGKTPVKPKDLPPPNLNSEFKKTTTPLKDSVDWTNIAKYPIENLTNIVVSPVQDQGYCGSCWAFSTVATVESAHAI